MIVPAYNAARTVGVALDSVLHQTYADFELIVIDDGSADSTADVVRSRQDARVQCVRIENSGVAHARNQGIALASGELVAFLDADDAWYSTKLDRQIATMMSTPSVGLCFASAEFVDDALIRIGEDTAVPFANYSEALLLNGNVVSGSCSSAMVRRALVTSAGGFDPTLSQCADWDLWLRLSLETEFAPISEPLVKYRKVQGTMSGDPALLEKDTFAMLDKFFARAESAAYGHLRPRTYSNQWMVCAGTYLHAGRLRDSVRCLGRGLAADPRNIRRPLLLPARLVSRGRALER